MATVSLPKTWSEVTAETVKGKDLNDNFTAVTAQVNGGLDDDNFDDGYKSPYFNVKAYGAEGDGTTDDATAIQAASDAAGVDGGIVFFPPGTYMIGSTIDCSANVVYRGVGGIRYHNIGGTGVDGVSIVKANSDFTSTDAMFEINDQDSVEFHGLEINAGGSNRYAQHCIYAHGGSKCLYVTNCLIGYANIDNIKLDTVQIAAFDRVIIHSCLGYGLNLATTNDSWMHGSYIFSCGNVSDDTGGAVRMSNSGTWEFTDTKFEFNNGYGLYHAGGTNTSDVHIQGCIFDTNGLTGLRMTSPTDWTVIGNIFTTNGANQSTDAGEKENLYVSGGSGWVIMGNRFKRGGDTTTPDIGVVLTGTISAAVFTGNVYLNSGDSSDIDTSGATISSGSVNTNNVSS